MHQPFREAAGAEALKLPVPQWFNSDSARMLRAELPVQGRARCTDDYSRGCESGSEWKQEHERKQRPPVHSTAPMRAQAGRRREIQALSARRVPGARSPLAIYAALDDRIRSVHRAFAGREESLPLNAFGSAIQLFSLSA